jgi:hypothetical protein
MQKKKPSFQVIPNYSINGAANWNESKEVPAEQGCVDMAWAISPAAAGLFCMLNRHRQTIAALACLGLNRTILPKKWCGAIVLLAQSWPGYGKPSSLNIQAKYETLSAGRPTSLS